MPEPIPQAAAPGGPFAALLGLEILEAGEETARARLVIREALLQPMGLIHGGIHPALAEALTTIAADAALAPEGRRTFATATRTSFLRPATAGALHAVARRRHRGRSTWVWEVDVTGDDGRLCALVRVTLGVEDVPAGA